MRIIAGLARNIELSVPPGTGVRPTSARGRKALLDSLGDLTDARVIDLFAGSGAFGLECASRGAAAAALVESSPVHASVIEENIRKVRKTGVSCDIRLLRGDAGDPASFISFGEADLIFADPPYAESGNYFRQLTLSPLFRQKFSGSFLVWEIPDTPGARGDFINAEHFSDGGLRQLGGVWFFTGTVTL